MQQRGLHNLPFRSSWMRTRQRRDTTHAIDPGDGGAQESVKSRQTRTSSPQSGSLPPQDPRVMEAFAAYDADDALRCIDMVEMCLRGLPTVNPSSSAPSAEEIQSATSAEPLSLPPLDETCALFHSGVRSYLAIRRPHEARRMCESWERYLSLHAVDGGPGELRHCGDDGTATASAPSPTLVAWRAIYWADAAEIFEHEGQWSAASELLTKAEREALKVTAAPQPVHPTSTARWTSLSQRDYCRLVLRRLTAQLRHANNTMDVTVDVVEPLRRTGHSGVPPRRHREGKRGEHRSLFSLDANATHPTSGGVPSSVVQAVVEEATPVLTSIRAVIPPPHEAVEWVDVWIHSRRCEAALMHRKACTRAPPSSAVLKTERCVLTDTLDEVRRAWRRVTGESNALAALLSPPLSAATSSSRLVAQTLTEAANATAERRAHAGRTRLSTLQVVARRLLEEWALLALDCLALDIAIATRQITNHGDDDSQGDGEGESLASTPSKRWVDVYDGEWVLAQLLSGDARAARSWTARQVEMAVRAAYLLLTVADVEKQHHMWFPRCCALQSDRLFGCPHLVVLNGTVELGAEDLVQRVVDALPYTPFLVYRHVDAGRRSDAYEHRLDASLSYLQGVLAERRGQATEALALHEKALQSWVCGALVSVPTVNPRQDDIVTGTHRAVRRSPIATRSQGRTDTQAAKTSSFSRTSQRAQRTPPPGVKETSFVCSALRCETLCTLLPRSELWHVLLKVMRKGTALRFLLSVIALVRCLSVLQPPSMARQLLRSTEALLAEAAVAPRASIECGRVGQAVSPTLSLALRLVRATLWCRSGAVTEVAQLCEDTLCDAEVIPAAASTFWPPPLWHDDACVFLMVSTQLPFVSLPVMRFHALHLWAAACARAHRLTEATELVRRLVHVTSAVTGSNSSTACTRRRRYDPCTAPSSLSVPAQEALLALGWILLDTGHAKEAQHCAAEVCERHQREDVCTRRSAQLSSSSPSRWYESALFRDADYLHACAVRRAY